MNYETLAQKAIDAKKFSYSPYSRFNVGAAILTKSGEIFTGCNIESASFSPTNCAERTAVFKAVSEGAKDFAAIAIVGGPEGGEAQYCYPCGVCRQVLKEFASDGLTVIIAKTSADFRIHTLGELFPHGFGPENLTA